MKTKTKKATKRKSRTQLQYGKNCPITTSIIGGVIFVAHPRITNNARFVCVSNRKFKQLLQSPGLVRVHPEDPDRPTSITIDEMMYLVDRRLGGDEYYVCVSRKLFARLLQEEQASVPLAAAAC